MNNSEKVGRLIGEIAAASREQAQGFVQVNSAVSKMNHVTQQNAAISEESASASTEIHSEIMNIRSHIRDVSVLGEGAPSTAQNSPAMSNHPQREVVTRADVIAI